MTHFTKDNTEGFTQEELNEMNTFVNVQLERTFNYVYEHYDLQLKEKINEFGFEEYDSDLYKTVCNDVFYIYSK